MSQCAQLIRKIRLNACLNQVQFAKRLGITPYCICRYEKAQQQPSFNTLSKIIEVANSIGMNLSGADFDMQTRREK